MFFPGAGSLVGVGIADIMCMTSIWSGRSDRGSEHGSTPVAGRGVHSRWHDLRHTFVSRLAENLAVSEETIRSGRSCQQTNAATVQPNPEPCEGSGDRGARKAPETHTAGSRAQNWAQLPI
jgi:hypothetical protein